MMSNEQLWLSVGLVGQAFFSMRFVVQWIASEKRKESVIPLAFWFSSIGGGLTLFTYAFHRLDPVFILGEGAGIFIYARNLYLIWRKHDASRAHTGSRRQPTPDPAQASTGSASTQ
jgi:lipid-A-disaccharide synthase-like uncharacterized protein